MDPQEIARVTEVNKYLKLDLSIEKELQAIVKMAADICGTPTALITLLTEDTRAISCGSIS